eukprot:SAG11_NODE_1586_length_4636_cov_9.336125_6_plen_37_part_00
MMMMMVMAVPEIAVVTLATLLLPLAVRILTVILHSL